MVILDSLGYNQQDHTYQTKMSVVMGLIALMTLELTGSVRGFYYER